MQWLTIRDIKYLIKKKLYEFETGSSNNLIYDRKTKQFVGHVDSNDRFVQSPDYIPSQEIIYQLQSLDLDEWKQDGKGW